MQKSRGSYYTPEHLADFVIRKAFPHCHTSRPIKILEPSCGDGAFLRAFSRNNSTASVQVEAVELHNTAIKKAKDAEKQPDRVRFHNADFLFFAPKIKYDLVIGNPPYITRKRLKAKQKVQCQNLHREAGLRDSPPHNVWTAFLIKSARHLAEDGVLAFVLPAELLQVKFAQEIQVFLKKEFQRIEVYSFQEMMFDQLGQDTIVLIALKKSAEPGVFFINISDLKDNAADSTLSRSKLVEGGNVKWTSYILSDADGELLLKLTNSLNTISKYCVAGAGIVTAANEFFIISEDVKAEFQLENYTKPIIQRGQFVNGSVVFDKVAFQKLKTNGKPCFILDLNNKPLNSLPPRALYYLQKGRRLGFQKRFKCKQRDRWYDVPSIWGSDAFFFKRSHLYPKLLLNRADVLVTDAAYRIKVNNDICAKSFVYSFYNSLTLAMAELRGRFYGGGVLELTPNEFKSLALPYIQITSEQFAEFQTTFENADSIADVLEKNDTLILKEGCGFSTDEIKQLQQIRKNLVNRRLRKKRKVTKT